MSASPARQLAAALATCSPEVRRVAKAALATMRRHLPNAVEFLYRTYAVVVGFGPNERPSDAVFSIVAYPRHVSLCFLHGALLDDPDHVLQGSGNQVRHIKLIPDASVLERPEIRAMIAQAIAASDVPLEKGGKRKMISRIRDRAAGSRPTRRPSR